MDKKRILISSPFSLTFRNFLFSGFANFIEDDEYEIAFVSPYDQSFIKFGNRYFKNYYVRSNNTNYSFKNLDNVSILDRFLASVGHSIYSLKYPNSSIATLNRIEKGGVVLLLGKIIIYLTRYKSIKAIFYFFYRIFLFEKSNIKSIVNDFNPDYLITSTGGYFWLDNFLLRSAQKKNIKTLCVVMSWDNLYTRGPFYLFPERLCVWNAEMKRVAIDRYGYNPENVFIVGALQFTPYKQVEITKQNPKHILFVPGAQTSYYDLFCLKKLKAALSTSKYKELPILYRPHPQGNRELIKEISDLGIQIANSPNLVKNQDNLSEFANSDIVFMGELIRDSYFVISSWGTTVLFESCLFNVPSIQLVFLDELYTSISNGERDLLPDMKKLEDFLNYPHMKLFDKSGARIYCYNSNDLLDYLRFMDENKAFFKTRQNVAVELITPVPYDDVFSSLLYCIKN